MRLRAQRGVPPGRRLYRTRQLAQSLLLEGSNAGPRSNYVLLTIRQRAVIREMRGFRQPLTAAVAPLFMFYNFGCTHKTPRDPSNGDWGIGSHLDAGRNRSSDQVTENVSTKGIKAWASLTYGVKREAQFFGRNTKISWRECKARINPPDQHS